MRYFFVESAEINKPVVFLKGSEARHIKNVLRLRPGDSVLLFDGSGFEYEAVIQKLSEGRAELCIVRKNPAVTESPVQLIVAQAFLKEKKMDALIRPLCELGMTEWVPYISERSVPRPDVKRLVDRTERWEKIARESFKQCRRSVLPEINQVTSYQEVLELGRFCDLRFIFWENETKRLPRSAAASSKQALKRIIIMLGPEGGFSEPEIKRAQNYGFEVAGLGPRILRSETATIAACTLIQYLYGDMG
jgi:16S rRNA (uracil1498-N3)-methyltransferase